MTITGPWQRSSVPESTDHWKQLIEVQGQESALPTAAHVVDMLDLDLEYLENSAGFIYSGRPTKAPNPTANLISHWQEEGGEQPPSLAAMCIFAVNNSDHKLSPEMSRWLMISALMGESETGLPFHNSAHNKKVLLQAMRLAQTDGTLDAERFTLLLVAACIHDVGHDGRGNLVSGIHRQGRNELEAFNRAAPKLKAAGMSEAMLRDLKIILLSTDTSSSPGKPSYASQMKAVYNYHQKKDSDLPVVEKDLEPLLSRPDLAHLALMVHEADVATSAGLSYDVTKHESILFNRETGDPVNRPKGVLSFMENICDNQFLSDAGQKLYGANMAAIITQLQADAHKGNKPFQVKSRYTPTSDNPATTPS